MRTLTSQRFNVYVNDGHYSGPHPRLEEAQASAKGVWEKVIPVPNSVAIHRVSVTETWEDPVGLSPRVPVVEVPPDPGRVIP